MHAPTHPPTHTHTHTHTRPQVVDPDEPNTIRLLLKPAMLAKVVHMWRSKANRGEEMLLYWKEDEEDVDDDEPYYQESDDEDS